MCVCVCVCVCVCMQMNFYKFIIAIQKLHIEYFRDYMQSSQLKVVVFCHHNDGVIFTEYHIYTSHTDDDDVDDDDDDEDISAHVC